MPENKKIINDDTNKNIIEIDWKNLSWLIQSNKKLEIISWKTPLSELKNLHSGFTSKEFIITKQYFENSKVKKEYVIKLNCFGINLIREITDYQKLQVDKIKLELGRTLLIKNSLIIKNFKEPVTHYVLINDDYEMVEFINLGEPEVITELSPFSYNDIRFKLPEK